MHRTNVYLTVEQEQALDARARAVGTTRSAVLRQIIDAAMAEPWVHDPEIAAAFTTLADSYDALLEALFDDDSDLRIDK